jgi:hypothetical protein
MLEEIINYPFDDELDDRERSDSYSRPFEETSFDHRGTDANITYVNGHNLPEDDDDDDEEEDDLILGDEDELDEADLAEDEIDVEIDEDVDDVIGDDDLVLDAEEDVEEEDDL